MIIIPHERFVESPSIDWVAQGFTARKGLEMRPAEYNWHLIFTRRADSLRVLVVGALEAARPLSYLAGAETLWIRFKAGTFLSHLPPRSTLNREVNLPQTNGDRFWLKDRFWEIPNFENAETFVEHLIRESALTVDPMIQAVLRNEFSAVSARTLRHHFQHSTGLGQKHIQQIQRAYQAVARLQQGNPIADTAYDLGYADQPHLTRSLKRLLGYTPGEMLELARQRG